MSDRLSNYLAVEIARHRNEICQHQREIAAIERIQRDGIDPITWAVLVLAFGEHAMNWIFQPVSVFGGQRAIDLILDGRTQPVIDHAMRVHYGVYT